MPEETSLKQFTRSQVEKESGEKTLIILHDKVYDVTKFLNEHPGGEEVLHDRRGKDASEDFNDVGHSKDAFDLMDNYLVGEIVKAERTNKPPKKGWIAGYNSKQPEKYVHGPGIPFYLLLGGMILALAIIIYIK